MAPTLNYVLWGLVAAIVLAIVCSEMKERYESNLLLNLLDAKDGKERQALRDLHRKNPDQQFDQPHFDMGQPPIKLI